MLPLREKDRDLMTRKYVTNTYTDKNGKFVKGNPGKPKGARHKCTLAIQTMLDGEAEALGRKAVELALMGGTTALRMCLDRIIPARKDIPVQFDMPTITSASEAAHAAQAVLLAVSEGKLTPVEATAVMALVERYGRVLELSEFEGRIVALERATATKSA